MKRALPQWMSEIWHMVSRPFASMWCSGSPRRLPVAPRHYIFPRFRR
jgi:hypothetical protein